ncbi:MAG: DUF550 domain-containing protein [Gemmatimonadales bacterium]|nr:DUF550 domain-containing protein [Gemmatimonadales bacterium]
MSACDVYGCLGEAADAGDARVRPLCAGHSEGNFLLCPMCDAAFENDEDLTMILYRQIDFSSRAFGPGSRALGIVAHIRKELREIEAAPSDLEEWIDVALLALDGAWRSGASPEEVCRALVAKIAKNEARTWPAPGAQDQAIEHIEEATS